MSLQSHFRSAFAAILLSIAFSLGTGGLRAIAVPPTVAPAGAMKLTSPSPYAVFQRSASQSAKIPIVGNLAAPAARVDAKATLMSPYEEGVDGKSVGFTTIAKPNAASFSGTLEVPAGGWYEITVRAKGADGKVIAQSSIGKVGVGEVFVAIGHSFCSAYNSDKPSKAKDDRVATCAVWSPSPGKPLSFRHCDDPLPPGDGTKSTPWPATGDYLVGRWHVPVLIVCTGIGGSTAAEWRKGADDPAARNRCYPNCRKVLQQLTRYTGLRAMIWFGNENDLFRGPAAEVFSDDLRDIIAHTRTDSGYANLPWIIAYDAYFPAVAQQVGAAEKQRRKERLDRGTEMVLETVPYTYDGPQTDDLGPEFRNPDGDHFNAAGVKQLGIRFGRKIDRAFFPPPVPAPEAPAGPPAE